jgi:hypothetical protein
MARSRILKPEFRSDEKLALLPREARLTFAELWTCSDDYGVTKGHPRLAQGAAFSLRRGPDRGGFPEVAGRPGADRRHRSLYGRRRILLFHPELRRSPEGGPAQQDAQSSLSSRSSLSRSSTVFPCPLQRQRKTSSLYRCCQDADGRRYRRGTAVVINAFPGLLIHLSRY